MSVTTTSNASSRLEWKLNFQGSLADTDFNHTALESLGSVDNMTVTGAAGGPWTIEFVGNQAGQAVNEMGGDATGATAGTLVRSINYTLDEVGKLTPFRSR